MNHPAKNESIVQTPLFAPIDVHFARLMEKFAGGNKPELELAAALVSHFRGEGHSCLNLAEFCASPRLAENEIKVPSLKKWREKLQTAAVVGKPGEFCPLIMEGDRLYLHRYWEYEQSVAQKIKARLQPVAVDEKSLHKSLDRLFGKNESDGDWQKVAALVAATKRFCVISGGPGTGKTSTVLKILALLLEQNEKLQIALVAPTGKAASRLQETIRMAREKLPVSEKIKAALPETASTIHRLLGTIPDSPYFRRHAKNLLPHDIVVLDEASMVDLALMAKLFEALREDARLILLGDKDQLSSVEAGAVLGDICGALPRADGQSPKGNVVELQKNYRFGEANAIFALSKNIREGNAAETRTLLGKKSEEFSWLPVAATFESEFERRVLKGFRDYLSAKNPTEALARLNQFRILAAVRQGPFGVVELNRKVEAILSREGLIDDSTPWYAGRPIMILRNDYNLDLFNGDIGMIAPDASGEMRACFLDAGNQLRTISPARLPEHETVFAMTVHKSQGSEFREVLFILPPQDSPVLTRELIYTGITRAREKVELWGNEKILEAALQRQVQRWSGLPELLAGS